MGKSTQTERIMNQDSGVFCVSTGKLVRRLDAKVAAGTYVLTEVERNAAESLALMRQGQLMNGDAVYALLMEYLSPGGEGYNQYRNAKVVIFDGIIKEYC